MSPINKITSSFNWKVREEWKTADQKHSNFDLVGDLNKNGYIFLGTALCSLNSSTITGESLDPHDPGDNNNNNNKNSLFGENYDREKRRECESSTLIDRPLK